MYENVAHLEIEITGLAVVREIEVVPLAGDGSATLPADGEASPVTDAQMAGRHGWHVRRGVTDPACPRCARGALEGLEGTLGAPRRGFATSLSSTGNQPSTEPDEREVATLPRARAALRSRWRWRTFTPRALALLEHIAASPLTGPTMDAGDEWIAAVVRDSPKPQRRLAHLAEAFAALGPDRRSSVLPEPADPNVDRLMRILRREPTGGQLRGLSDFEHELGAERVGIELEALIAAGAGDGPSPMGGVVARLRHVCQEQRAEHRQTSAVFGRAGRPLEHSPDQYDAKVRRDPPREEVPHG